MDQRVIVTRSIRDILSPDQLVRVDSIGAALFCGGQMRVGFKGVVSAKPPTVERQAGVEHGQPEGPQRSPAGARSGRQGPSSRPGHSDPSDLVRWAVQVGEQFEALRQEYPSAKKFSDPYGTWLAVRSFPIGEDGPQTLLLIAIPQESFKVEAWAFWLMQTEVVWIGPRHTNIPSGSACAFPPDSDYLDCEWPLRRYVDLLTEWCARHLYHAVHVRWPGPQEGRWALYRLRETQPQECCPRCGGLTYYEECCKARDEAMLEDGSAEAEDLPDLGSRMPPSQIYEWARRVGRNPPRMSHLFQ